MTNYSKRLDKVYDWMAQEGITLLVLEDCEARRDQNIRWLTGHPGDALLLLSAERKAVLAAWDINLAKVFTIHSPVMIVPYNSFDCQSIKAIASIAQLMGLAQGSKIEIPSVTPYPVFLEYVGELDNYDILCRKKGASVQLRKLRAVKDEEEISVVREAAAITNDIIDLLEKKVRSGKIKTEADAALLIQSEARKRNCEGTSFETLAAGPYRSYSIHAFPTWTDSPFACPGLSILDFGVKLKGYCTDVTLTFTNNLSPKQEKMVTLVEKAWKLALSMANAGTVTRDIAAAVEKFFTKSRKSMPHNLGHGIGLQEHEYPVLKCRRSNTEDTECALEPGMIFTIEPGLYDPAYGGCRLENDVLITESGPEVLTNSRIVHL